MINQQESSPLEPPQEFYPDFIQDLLQEAPLQKGDIEPTRMKLESEVGFLMVEEGEARQEQEQIGFRLLEMEDLNSPLPLNPFPELGQDRSHQNILPQNPHSIKKQPKFQRLAYLEETRADKIARYKRKKSRRVWDRKISYDCRKLVADNRPRVNGRFAKKSPLPPCTDSKSPQSPSPIDLLDHHAPQFDNFSL